MGKKEPTLRYRHNSAITVAGVIGMIASLSVLSWKDEVPFGVIIPVVTACLLISLSVAVWGWRAGTDANASGITVRALIGGRQLPWDSVTALQTEDRRVVAYLASGTSITLPAVPPNELPALIATSGHDVESPAAQ